MRLASLALLVMVAAGGCGKKRDRDGEPAVPPAGADAGPRPPGSGARPHDMLDRAPFVIQLSYVEAEHSKDSSSRTAHATVIGDKLFYKSSESGAHDEAGEAIEINNQTLSADEVAALQQSITDKNLLTAKGVQGGDAPSPSFTVRADLQVRIDDQRNHLSIIGALRTQGKETALAATDAYRSVSAFAAELGQLARKHQR
jgi:hypothetical protein